MNWLLGLLTSFGGGVTATVEGWQARQTARVEAEVKTITARAEAEATIMVANATAQARLAESAQAGEINWDLAAVQQMDRSWKDEWFVLLFSVPLILAFIDPSIVARGFEALDGMPAWYFYSLGTAVAASFGMRRLLTLFEASRGRR